MNEIARNVPDRLSRVAEEITDLVEQGWFLRSISLCFAHRGRRPVTSLFNLLSRPIQDRPSVLSLSFARVAE